VPLEGIIKMNPITHALTGWSIACSAPLERRERGVVVLAGIISDFDGLGVIVDFLTKNSQKPTEFWGTYHHILGHNIGCALIVAIIAYSLSSRRWLTTLLALLSFQFASSLRYHWCKRTWWRTVAYSLSPSIY